MNGNPINLLRMNRPDLFEAPAFWKSGLDDIAKTAGEVKTMKSEIIGKSAGGRDVFAFSSGKFEPRHPKSTISSATASDNPDCFFDLSARTAPSLLIIGSIHGGETEGIAVCANLINIIETGEDLNGNDRRELRGILEKVRLNIIPCLNPDGRAKAGISHLSGAEVDHIFLVQQGVKKDGSLFKGRAIKEVQPIPDGYLAFRGGYYNNDGVNLQHDDFFSGGTCPENKALIRLFKREAPDAFLTFHSHGAKPSFTGSDRYLFPGYAEKQKNAIANIARDFREKDIEIGESVDAPTASFYFQTYFSHVNGALPLLFELPHGTVNHPYSLDEILEFGLLTAKSWTKFAIDNKLHKNLVSVHR